ncbi:MAG: carbohydrate binding domain-containing protein, partial [Candidatus Ratteibacteria bacterium]|nr:carbohydrate binding domain-containing protein [Candidatus Ratteibacteria bacterium]
MKYFFTVLIFIVILSLIPAYCENINILANPDFEEESIAGWVGRGCQISLSKDSHSGLQSGFAHNRTATWQGISQSLLGKIKKGGEYEVSAWVKIGNAESDNVYITAEQSDENGIKYIRIASGVASSSQWIQLSGTFKPEITGELFVMNIYAEGPASGVDIYVDEVNVFGSLADLTPSPNAKGSVDTTIRYQIIEGFGASVAWQADWLNAHPRRTRLYNLLFKELNLNAYRFSNTYLFNHKNLNETAKIIKNAEHILGHPLKIKVAAWTPPAFLKSNNDLVGGTLKKDSDGKYVYEEFARWWADSLFNFSKKGINVDYLSIQNEPDTITQYESCRLIPNEDADTAGYNLALEAVYQELHARMGDKMPKLLAPDTMGFRNSRAYIDALINPEHVYGYAHHIYSDGVGAFENPRSYVGEMIGYAKQYGNKPLYQTEYSRNSNYQRAGFNDAIFTAWHIHNCLVYESVKAYYYWDLIWNQEVKGLISLARPKGSRGYTINPSYYALKHFSAFTDDGWQRI